MRGLQPLPSRQAKRQLRGVQPLPSREAEKQLRGVHPLPPRQAEKRLRGVHRLPSRQAKEHVRDVQNGTRGSAACKHGQTRAGEFARDQARAVYHSRLFRHRRRGVR